MGLFNFIASGFAVAGAILRPVGWIVDKIEDNIRESERQRREAHGVHWQDYDNHGNYIGRKYDDEQNKEVGPINIIDGSDYDKDGNYRWGRGMWSDKTPREQRELYENYDFEEVLQGHLFRSRPNPNSKSLKKDNGPMTKAEFDECSHAWRGMSSANFKEWFEKRHPNRFK